MDRRLDDPSLPEDHLLDAIRTRPILMNRAIILTPRGTRLCRPCDDVVIEPAYDTAAKRARSRARPATSRPACLFRLCGAPVQATRRRRETVQITGISLFAALVSAIDSFPCSLIQLTIVTPGLSAIASFTINNVGDSHKELCMIGSTLARGVLVPIARGVSKFGQDG